MDELYGYVGYIPIKLFFKKAGEFELKECAQVQQSTHGWESMWKQVLSTRWQDVT